MGFSLYAIESDGDTVFVLADSMRQAIEKWYAIDPMNDDPMQVTFVETAENIVGMPAEFAE